MANEVTSLVVTPNAEFLDGQTPVVHLDGKDWPIPVLAPRQNRYVIPACIRMLPKIAKLANNDGDFSQDDFDQLLIIVFWGLKRAHPNLPYERFLDWPISMDDILNATRVIAEQTRTLKKDAPQAGEA